MPSDQMADATKAIHAAREADGHPGLPGTPVVDPIVQSANFTRSPGACSPGSGIVTVRAAGGDTAAHIVQQALRLIQPATSLGGIESLVCIPAETSHLPLTDGERFALGILPGTLRFSFGLEDPSDLLRDLAAALSRLSQEGG